MVDEAEGEGGDSGDGEGDVVDAPAPPKITLRPKVGQGPWASHIKFPQGPHCALVSPGP